MVRRRSSPAVLLQAPRGRVLSANLVMHGSSSQIIQRLLQIPEDNKSQISRRDRRKGCGKGTTTACRNAAYRLPEGMVEMYVGKNRCELDKSNIDEGMRPSLQVGSAAVAVCIEVANF